MKKFLKGLGFIGKELIITFIVFSGINLFCDFIRKILYILPHERREINILIQLIVLGIYIMIVSYYFSIRFKTKFKEGFSELMKLMCLGTITMFFLLLVCYFLNLL